MDTFDLLTHKQLAPVGSAIAAFSRLTIAICVFASHVAAARVVGWIAQS